MSEYLCNSNRVKWLKPKLSCKIETKMNAIIIDSDKQIGQLGRQQLQKTNHMLHGLKQ